MMGLQSFITNDTFSQFGSWLATIMLFWSIYRHYLPSKLHESIEYFTSQYSKKLTNYFTPYLTITFNEYSKRFVRNEAYESIQSYLGDKSSTQARSMDADYVEDAKTLLLKLGNEEEIIDQYNGVQVWWTFFKHNVKQQGYDLTSSEKRYYHLVFHAKHRKFVLERYLPYVLEEGEEIGNRNRRRKLYTNANGSWDNYIDFKHPARFEMLAMEETKKQIILEDLEWFKSSKEYYARIGKPWKRGYLLYGPPGTGKSTLVAAMANLIDYDIYDLELTEVKNNKQLRSLLIETTSKSIILIEDIDCSLDLTGQRAKKKTGDEEKDVENQDPSKATPVGDKAEGSNKKKQTGSEVTLSGLLNFIDGIWSACGEERIIVFTTNHVDKLDPALIRRGRMDLHIELSYCRYDAFKVLARNYLLLESHSLFEPIGRMLEEIDVTPADVAENLMPRSLKNTTPEDCLRNLMVFLEKIKQEKKLKSEQETTLETEEKEAAETSVEENSEET